MKNSFILSLLAILLFAPSELFAQNRNSVSGAMITTTTSVSEMQQKKKLYQKLDFRGEVGFYVGEEGLGFNAAFIAAYKIKDIFSVGGGIGFGYDEYDESLWVPLFANGKVTLLKNTKVKPFLSLSLGANIPYGLYLNPNLGIDIPLKTAREGVSLYVMTGYEGMHVSGLYFLSNLGLKVGIAF